MRIPKRNLLNRIDNEHLFVYDMCALSIDEVLLACGAAGLRGVSLHTAQLVAHESSAIREVYGVAFDAHTDTLLLLVARLAPTRDYNEYNPGDYHYSYDDYNEYNPGDYHYNYDDYYKIDTDDYYQLVSLRRNASEWLEVQRLDTRILHNEFFNFAVCDSRVLLVQRGGNKMYVFDVSTEHTLRDAGSLTLQSSFYGVTCTRRDGVTLVAFSHDTSVTLLRLTSLPLRLVPLASVSLTAPGRLRFRGDLLLVADWNDATGSHAIVSFRASDNALTERRVLLDAQAGVRVGAWALASDRLVLWNWKTEELLVYDYTCAICERASRRNRRSLLNSL